MIAKRGTPVQHRQSTSKHCADDGTGAHSYAIWTFAVMDCVLRQWRSSLKAKPNVGTWRRASWYVGASHSRGEESVSNSFILFIV